MSLWLSRGHSTVLPALGAAAAGCRGLASSTGVEGGKASGWAERLRRLLPPWGVDPAYRRAEESARAVLASQLKDSRDGPTMEQMWAPEEEVPNEITGARNWKIDNADAEVKQR